MALKSNPGGYWFRQLTVLISMVVVTLFKKSLATSLKGKHLIILPSQLIKYMETTVNSSGHVIEASGSVPEMLHWLTHRLQFDYSFVPFVEWLVPDDTPEKRGKLSYLRNNEADLVVGVIVITHQRFQQVDFPMPYLWSSFGSVVPAPKSTTSISALLHPWKVEVWVGAVLVLPIFILFLLGLSKLYSSFVQKVSRKGQQSRNSRDIAPDSIIKYVFEVILSQGGYLSSQITVIRIATATWCLACFILVQSYNCTLTSVLTVPQFAKPIINSIYDIPKVKNLWVIVDRGLAADNIFSRTEFGILKQFGTMLNKNPGLRCNNSEECINRVKFGPYVYIALAPFLDFAIEDDYKKEGVCHTTLLNERFMSSLLAFAVVKKSVYLEEFNRGIEEMMGYGLVQYWDKKYIAPKKVLCHYDKRPLAAAQTRLSLTHLASAFALLLLGYLLSFLVFLVEILIHHNRRT